MIDIEYTTDPKETAAATLDFLSNRPLMSFMFKFMQVMCFLLCAGFAITVYNKSARPQDWATAVTACLWLLFYKPINRWVIRSGLKYRSFGNNKCVVRMDDKSVFCKINTANPQHVEWKKLKYVIKNKEGYIVPLTGMANAGKFLWLPMRCFTSPELEQQFLQLAQKFKLQLKFV